MSFCVSRGLESDKRRGQNPVPLSSFQGSLKCILHLCPQLLPHLGPGPPPRMLNILFIQRRHHQAQSLHLWQHVQAIHRPHRVSLVFLCAGPRPIRVARLTLLLPYADARTSSALFVVISSAGEANPTFDCCEPSMPAASCCGARYGDLLALRTASWSRERFVAGTTYRCTSSPTGASLAHGRPYPTENTPKYMRLPVERSP